MNSRSDLPDFRPDADGVENFRAMIRGGDFSALLRSPDASPLPVLEGKTNLFFEGIREDTGELIRLLRAAAGRLTDAGTVGFAGDDDPRTARTVSALLGELLPLTDRLRERILFAGDTERAVTDAIRQSLAKTHRAVLIREAFCAELPDSPFAGQARTLADTAAETTERLRSLVLRLREERARLADLLYQRIPAFCRLAAQAAGFDRDAETPPRPGSVPRLCEELRRYAQTLFPPQK